MINKNKNKNGQKQNGAQILYMNEVVRVHNSKISMELICS